MYDKILVDRRKGKREREGSGGKISLHMAGGELVKEDLWK